LIFPLHGKILIHSNFLETIICFCLHKTSHQYCRVQFGVHCSHTFLSTIASLESYKSKSPTLEINENMHTQDVQRRKVSYIAHKSKYASPATRPNGTNSTIAMPFVNYYTST
jgi:hypothetical protein